MDNNQRLAVLKYLKNNKSGITSLLAFELFGATRLSAIIFDLKKKGYNIVSLRENGVTRYGSICQYARYILIPEEDNE